MHAQQRMLAALLLAVITVALHWPAGEVQFSLDDTDFIVENESIRRADTAVAAMLRSFPPAQNGRALYRPLTNLSHALEWPWFGVEPAGYMAVNALLYAGVVLGLFALLCQYEIRLGAAFGAALLFAVHPVHSEAVDPAAGRSELLALGFSLLCLLAFSRALYPKGSRKPRSRLASGPQWLALLAFAAASLSKETGLVTGALLAVQVAMARRKDGQPAALRRAALDLAPFAVMGVGILLIRFGVLQRFSPDPSTYDFAFASGWERIVTLGAVTLEYARLIVWPDVLQIDFYYERRIGVQHGISARVLAGWSLLAASAGALGFAIHRWRTVPPDPRSPLAAGILGGSMFGLYLLPVSHVVDVGALMAERFLFAPSAGLALVVGALLSRAAEAKRPIRFAIVAGVVLAAVAGGWRSASRAAEWRNPQALWTALTVALPEDARGWTSLSALALQRGDLAASAEALDRARALAPADYAVRFNEAALALERGNVPEAEGLYRKMIATGGVDHRVWLSLASIDLRRHRHSAAREHLVRALAIQPNYAPTHALQQRVETELERFGAYLTRHRAALATSEDPMKLASIATACRAVGDRACERAARQRARALQSRELDPAPTPTAP